LLVLLFHVTCHLSHVTTKGHPLRTGQVDLPGAEGADVGSGWLKTADPDAEQAREHSFDFGGGPNRQRLKRGNVLALFTRAIQSQLRQIHQAAAASVLWGEKKGPEAVRALVPVR